MPLGEINIDTKGAIAGLKEFRTEVREELKKVYPGIGRRVVAEAKMAAPVGVGTKRPGALRASIKQTAMKTAANIKIGGTLALPYAAPAHWGWDGKSGTWFAYRVGYPDAKPGRGNRGLIADWIWGRNRRNRQ